MKPRFKPIPTVATAVGFAILMSLGTWQYNRYHEKLGLEAELAERVTLSPTRASSLEQLDVAKDSSRVLEFEGTLERSRSAIIKHRTLEGRPGVWLVAPLRLKGGGVLVVNQGWLPVKESEALAEKARATGDEKGVFKGLFHLLGQNIEDTRTRKQLDTLNPSEELIAWNTFDVEALGELYGPNQPDELVVLVLTKEHSGDPFPIASVDYITKPYMSSDRHLGYSAFWYTTGAALLALYVAASFGLVSSAARRAQAPLRSEPDESS